MLCYLKGRHPLGCFSLERLEVNLTSAKGFFLQEWGTVFDG